MKISACVNSIQMIYNFKNAVTSKLYLKRNMIQASMVISIPSCVHTKSLSVLLVKAYQSKTVQYWALFIANIFMIMILGLLSVVVVFGPNLTMLKVLFVALWSGILLVSVNTYDVGDRTRVRYMHGMCLIPCNIPLASGHCFIVFFLSFKCFYYNFDILIKNQKVGFVVAIFICLFFQLGNLFIYKHVFK